ncbi:MAG TPA: polysaccharide deacetylase family protein [Ohtaekwangia sp.]|uniref:polysaccharide deacetylase family protein n=1 Tax=Ohtaekwangia sp. TaxID=2066019 RepID=UPI002F958619
MSRFWISNIAFLVLFFALYLIDAQHGISVAWYILLIVLLVVIHTFGSIYLSMQFFIPTRCKGISDHAIAITFDDGPIAGMTDKILTILKEHNVKASFFCIGHRVAREPMLAKRLHEEGHLLGNHTYWHKATFDIQSAKTIAKELADTDKAIVKAVGVEPRFFRPPYGVTNPMVASGIKRGGKYTVVGWSVRSFDTVIKDRAKLFERVTKSLKSGDIVLFHDYSESTLDILSDFLHHVSKLGLKVVRVDELLNEKAYV